MAATLPKSPPTPSSCFMRRPARFGACLHQAAARSELLTGYYATNFAVTPDGIYYLAAIEGSRRATVNFWDFRTKQAKIILTVEKRWAPGLSISPDGRSLLITVVDQEESDLVMIERTP